MFSQLTRHIWKCGGERQHEENHGYLFIEKVFSCFLHFAGVHNWRMGKFVDIFHEQVGPYIFKEDAIQNLWMRSFFSCEHELIDNEEIVDFQSVAYQLLLAELSSNLRLNQLHRAARFVPTSYLESTTQLC